jgi:hypothetical protein
MALAGDLSEYSFAEICRFIYEGQRSGLLEIYPEQTEILKPQKPRNLWIENGRIIAVTAGMDGKELLTTIGQRKLIPQQQINQIVSQIYQINLPMGIYLKSQGLLDAEQLRLLYHAQTIAPLAQLFEFNHGKFQFNAIRANSTRVLACSEMTGIGLTAREIGMKGLRAIKDWSRWINKFPDPNYALQKSELQQPDFRLDLTEVKLWSLADGLTPLTKLASQIDKSIEVVQWVSYRLILFGLVREIPLKPTPTIVPPTITITNLAVDRTPAVSTSFLLGLKNFLKRGTHKSVK